MLIEWHIIDGRAEAYSLIHPCCEHWYGTGDFQHYINFQPDGVYLEVPTRLDVLLLEPYHGADAEDEPVVHWKRIGKLEWCPFCGARISMYKTVISD